MTSRNNVAVKKQRIIVYNNEILLQTSKNWDNIIKSQETSFFLILTMIKSYM